MSFAQKPRKFGPARPTSSDNHMSAVEITTSTYTSTMSSVLRRVFDGCAKKVANFAGCNVETAKNWLEGRNAPNGALLIRMIRESDDVLAAVLELAERPKEAKKVRATAVLRQLEAILGDEE